jgi:hypothetical protein
MSADRAIVCPEGRARSTLRMAGVDQYISVYATRHVAPAEEAAA